MQTILKNDGNIANALEVQNDNLEKVMGDGVQFMTSTEIAQICEKEHVHVMRDIRRMLEDLGEEVHYPNLDSENFGEKGWIKTSYKNSRNQEQPMYLLDKNLSLTLVAGYNVVLRNRIINRWLELERKEQERETMEALDNPAALRKILLAYTGRVIALEDEVKKQDKYINYLEPNAVAFEKIGETDEDFTITQVSKMLDVKRNFLINFLQENNFIYRQNGKITPTNFAEAKGWLIFKVCKNGFSHTYITSKGCQAISLLFVKNFPNINFHK